MVNIYEKTLSLIKIRSHHSGELRRKLLMRGFDRKDVDQTIFELISQGLINDAQFGQMYLESLIKYKTFGYYGIKAKLLGRGIASNEAENLLQENFPLELEKEIALKLLGKTKALNKMQAAGKLSRKGFRSPVISEIVQNML